MRPRKSSAEVDYPVPKRASIPAFDDDPWGFGQSDGVLVEVRQEAPVLLDDTLTRADVMTSNAPGPPAPAPSRRRFRVAAAVSGAAVVASVATAAVTWWLLRPAGPTRPAVVVSSAPVRPNLDVDGAGLGDVAGAQPSLAAPVAAAPVASASAGPSVEAVAPPPVAFGAVAFDAPFDLGVYRQGRFIGAVESTPLRVPAGTHTFELVNERLGFRAWQTLEIVAGQTTRRVIQNRTAPLTLDVRPPAEVVIDGHSYGEISRADIELSLGTRIVVVRHPAFGERTVPVIVALGAPNHLSIELRP